MIPQASIPSVTIRGQPVRLYQHPTVPNGRPWCALHDMALVAGYPSDQAEEVVTAFRAAYSDLTETGHDGAAIVSDAVVCGFITYLGMMGVSWADDLRGAYDMKSGKAWLAMTAHLPRPEWDRVLQRSTLADALPKMDVGVN